MSTHHIDVGGQGLLAQNVQVFAHRLDGLFGVNRSRSADYYGIEPGVLQHLLVVVVQSHAIGLEVELAPGELLLVRRKGSNEFCAGRPIEEVEGMSLAHATESGGGNLELLAHDRRLRDRGNCLQWRVRGTPRMMEQPKQSSGMTAGFYVDRRPWAGLATADLRIVTLCRLHREVVR